MKVQEFTDRVRAGDRVSFQETIRLIEEHYVYTPSRFTNGIGLGRLVNEPGTNEGSCRIFAFAKVNGLSPEHTLALFGDFYWKDVLENPEECDHHNIRTFQKHGWPGIVFEQDPLKPRD